VVERLHLRVRQAARGEVTQRAYDYVRTEHDVTEMGRRYLARFEQLLARR